jgi:hypothetical protein
MIEEFWTVGRPVSHTMLRTERLSIAVMAADDDADPKTSDDLTAFITGAPKESPLQLLEVEPMHSARYPRLRCWYSPGRMPTWHLWACVPAEKTLEAARAEYAELFAKNGWKVLT